MIRRLVLPVIILSLYTGPIGLFAEDDSIGLNRFNITTIPMQSDICSYEFCDFNQDGLNDIFLISTGPRFTGSIYLQKKGGFSDAADFQWQIDGAATALLLGDFMPETGIEIGYLTSDEFWAYYFVPDTESSSQTGMKLACKKILDATPIFIKPERNYLPILQKPVDIDRNGYDDALIPQLDGYRVYFQETPGGKFTSCPVGHPAEKSFYQTSASFIVAKHSLPNILIKDINADGMIDAVMLKGDELNYYLQNESAALSERFTVTASGSSRIKSLENDADPNEFNQVALDFSDINQDKLIDMMISIMKGKIDSLGDVRTQVLVFQGSLQGQDCQSFCYKETPDQVINLKGVVPLARLDDVNEDGNLDLITASFQMDMTSNIQKVLLRYLALTYHIRTYQAKSRKFSSNPDYERSINFPLELIGKGTSYFSHIYFKDFDGDKRPDVLTISSPDKRHGKLNIRLSRKRDKLGSPLMVSFGKDDYLLYRLRIPSGVDVLDFNMDGKNDIILRYSTRIIIMISK
ncbi:MAG: VCBS repeat-containing protein [Planctomycetes bacterium]|nr:VCBS repeat-containing protein [Planctomycetota bacterium]